MNYLAHLLLSGDNEEIIIGNYIGDAIKGKDLAAFEVGIQKGIMMHRNIDTFADGHSTFRESKKIFVPVFDKYSGVLIDVFYDHFLAKEFHQHHHVDLADFSSSTYSTLQKNSHHLPYHSTSFLEYMMKYDILKAYATIDGIQYVLKGLTRRIGGKVDLVNAIPILENNYDVLEKQFESFFAEAHPHFKKWLNQPAH